MMQTGYNEPSMPPVIVYQVEFNAIATGKVIAMSKRRIRWRYGFPNQAAIDEGQSGTACRGEEHDVTLVWSVTSGKRMIMSNGKQLSVETVKTSVIEHSWVDSRGNSMRLVAHATAPVSSKMGSRQYDLFINGKSYFTLPKSYEIGLKGPKDNRIPGVITDQDTNYSSPSHGRGLVPHSREEEMADLKKAIEASINESRQHLSSRGKLEEGSVVSSVKTPASPPVEEVKSQKTVEEPLIDFLSDPIPTVSLSAHHPQTQHANNTLVLLDAAPQQYQVDPFAYNTSPAPVPMPSPAYNNMNTTPVDEFAPKDPSYSDISDQILLNYSTPQSQTSPTPAPVNTIAQGNPFGQISPQNVPQQYGHNQNAELAQQQQQQQQHYQQQGYYGQSNQFQY